AALALVPVLTLAAYAATLRLQQLPPLAVTAQTAAPAASAADSQAAALQVAQAEASRRLQQLVGSLTPAIGAPHGLVVKDLKSGAIATSSDQQVFTSASLYKLFVAQGIYRAIDAGSLSLGDRIGGRTVADCLHLMITVSDNPCGEALGARLGWGKYNDTLKTQGFTGTSLTRPLKTSAADVALLLERLYHGTLLSPNSSEHFLGLLKAQRINNRLPAGLPAGTVMAHKTGDLDGLVHDAGIVYGPKTDYVVVMTSGPWANPLAAPAAFNDLSARLWEHFNQ
ncbi:MAG TPA: serine hydrolase, partial [Candidatus Saccharimonadales bacterium]|nr:serine hydrolase [Candidatus Saccharimonadales bacterium]